MLTPWLSGCLLNVCLLVASQHGPRLVERDGAARTLIASYKNPHCIMTEFVGDEAETLAFRKQRETRERERAASTIIQPVDLQRMGVRKTAEPVAPSEHLLRPPAASVGTAHATSTVGSDAATGGSSACDHSQQAGYGSTAVAGMGQEIKWQSQKPPRFFTPRECARLQGFPETYALQWAGATIPDIDLICGWHSLG